MRPALLFVLALLLVPARVSAGEAEEERRLNDLAFDVMLEGQARIMAIADRIRIAGADLCGKKIAPVIGVFAADYKTIADMWREKDYVDPFIEAGIERYQLGRQPRVLAVVPGLAADEAGLKPGDVVQSIDGVKVKKRVYLDVLRKRGQKGVVRLGVDRNGETLSLDVKAVMGCTVPSRFMYGTDINAYAMSFGRITAIYFHSGLLRYFSNDDHLAMIVGHELAHHVLGHTNQPRTSERTEAEADYLGLYFSARAGFDISTAPEVEDALARASPYSSVGFGFYTHPTSARRSLEMRAAISEVEGKRALGEAMEPERGRFTLERPKIDEKEMKSHREALRLETLEIFRSDQTRIQNVSYRLVTAGAAGCVDRLSPVLGATVGRARDFFFTTYRASTDEEDIAAAFGVGPNVTVFAVADGSPAQRVGLEVGDEILSVDGRSIKRTKHVFEQLRDSRSGAIRFHVRRGQEQLDLELPRVMGCPFGTLTLPGSQAVTHYHANKKEVIVPTGLVRFVRDDDELAIAIGHQMGHHLIGRFRIAKNEPRADELGLEIAAAAGYDVRKAPAFWDRWAAEQFWTISSEMEDIYIPHGAMSLRAPAIREAVKAIEAERVKASSE